MELRSASSDADNIALRIALPLFIPIAVWAPVVADSGGPWDCCRISAPPPFAAFYHFMYLDIKNLSCAWMSVHPVPMLSTDTAVSSLAVTEWRWESSVLLGIWLWAGKNVLLLPGGMAVWACYMVSVLLQQGLCPVGGNEGFWLSTWYPLTSPLQGLLGHLFKTLWGCTSRLLIWALLVWVERGLEWGQ